MIEIVFSESARGSLKVAQGYCVGKYHDGDWENAIPLGSNRKDIYCFDIALSVGEITEKRIGSQRRTALQKLILNSYPMEDLEQILDEKLQNTQNDLDSVLDRCSAGESVRVWYSHNPDEMCGMYWLMSKIRPLNCRGSVYLVKLPEWEYNGGDMICMYNGWGEVDASKWGYYQNLQQEVQPAFFFMCSAKWNQLKEENAPLRVFINGHLQSVSENIYDDFILREIDKQSETFVEAIVIGNVLGKYQLGIGDSWIALRIDKMIKEGKLEIVEHAPKGDMSYRKRLRKCYL